VRWRQTVSERVAGAIGALRVGIGSVTETRFGSEHAPRIRIRVEVDVEVASPIQAIGLMMGQFLFMTRSLH
jgi:hypothetical protein